MIRSILAVLAGLITLSILSFALEAAANPLLMHLFPKVLPDAGALAENVPARWVMLAYTTLSIAAGGYVTAWIARRSQLTHAAIMGAIEAALTLYLMLAVLNLEPHPAPRWAWIAGILLMVPAACLGAALRTKQAHTPYAPA